MKLIIIYSDDPDSGFKPQAVSVSDWVPVGTTLKQKPPFMLHINEAMAQRTATMFMYSLFKIDFQTGDACHIGMAFTKHRQLISHLTKNYRKYLAMYRARFEDSNGQIHA